MKNYRKETQEVELLEGITCDICGKTFTDVMETQEFLSIDFYGGYNSIFGDDNKVECDVCQYCLKEKLGQYVRVKPSDLNNIPD